MKINSICTTDMLFRCTYLVDKDPYSTDPPSFTNILSILYTWTHGCRGTWLELVLFKVWNFPHLYFALPAPYKKSTLSFYRSKSKTGLSFVAPQTPFLAKIGPRHQVISNPFSSLELSLSSSHYSLTGKIRLGLALLDTVGLSLTVISMLLAYNERGWFKESTKNGQT